MPRRRLTRYDSVAGRRIDRLAALSDCVFAVAMTLLVLDLRAQPSRQSAHPLDRDAKRRAIECTLSASS